MKIGRFLNPENGEVFWGQVMDNYLRVWDSWQQQGIHSEISLDSLEVLTPVEPKKIIAVGLNYRQHAVEMGMAIPDEPVLFLKPHTAVLPHRGTICYPSMSRQVDYEAELAIVIGRRAKNVPESEAREVVWGFTPFNDVTARDLQKKDGQWARAKGFDTFAPFGPYIETEIEDANNLRIQALLNGVVKQDSNTSDMIFPVYDLVSFISRIFTLEEGDIIATGTPSGIGPMNKGDTITIRIEGLDELINTVG